MATKKPGKYTEAIKGLEKSVPKELDLDYQAKIDLEKERLKTGEMASADERGDTLVLQASLQTWMNMWNKNGMPVEVTPEVLGLLFIKVTNELEAIENVRYLRQIRLKAIEQMLIDSHETRQPGWGLYGAAPHTVKLASGDCLDVLHEPEAKVEDKEVFRLWCIKHGLEHKLQLWPATMAAISKERLLEGMSPPDGVTVKVRMKVKYRRA